jgi:hypothetical protein
MRTTYVHSRVGIFPSIGLLSIAKFLITLAGENWSARSCVYSSQAPLRVISSRVVYGKPTIYMLTPDIEFLGLQRVISRNPTPSWRPAPPAFPVLYDKISGDVLLSWLDLPTWALRAIFKHRAWQSFFGPLQFMGSTKRWQSLPPLDKLCFPPMCNTGPCMDIR